MDPEAICAKSAELIDRLERHKAALEGLSELKVGPRAVIADLADTIQILNESYAFILDNHVRQTR